MGAPQFPTLADAVALAPEIISKVTSKQFDRQLAWDLYVVEGYGLSQAMPATPVQMAPHAAHALLVQHMNTLVADPSKINWGNLLQIILTVLQGLGPILGGLGGAGAAGS